MVSACTGSGVQLTNRLDTLGLVCSVFQQGQRLVHQEWVVVTVLDDLIGGCLAATLLDMGSMVGTSATSGCQACGTGAGS